MPPDPLPPRSSQPPLRGAAAAVFRALLPHVEREEALSDLASEHARREQTGGRTRAQLWLWRQLIGSLPALLHRCCWRGMTGFESRANRMHTGGPMLESWIIDLRYSARRLLSRPTYTALAVLTLALGVGGTAAVFSVVRTLLLEPLPVAGEAQVGVFWMPGTWTEQEFLHLRPSFPGFQTVAAYRAADGTTLDVPGQPLRLLAGISASSELFDVLGASTHLGRPLKAGDDVQGAEPVVVLSHTLWQDLGGDVSIIGRQLTLGGSQRTVVGVMPSDFWFPAPTTQVWLSRMLRENRQVGELTLIGRVAHGQRIDGMAGPLAAMTALLAERFQYPAGEWDKLRAPHIVPLRDDLVGDVRPGLVATLAAMALLLLIACVNVSALMLGQVSGRATEMSVRAALGADRARLLRQVGIEALLLGALAAVAGALLAAAAFGVIVRSLPLGALAAKASLDWTHAWIPMVLALAAVATTAAVPALAVWRAHMETAMVTTRTASMSARGGRLEGGLVVVQIALAVLLAAGAGLIVRSVSNLRAINPGVDVDAVVVLDATVPTQLTPDERRRVYLDALSRLQTLPGVRAAAATQRLPLRGSSDNWGVRVEGRPDLDGGTTAVRVVTHDYFEALDISVRRGRGFLPADRDTTERIVVINEALADRYFAGEDPIGRLLHTGFDAGGERIVGVVENVAEGRLTDPPGPARYMLYEQVLDSILPTTTFVLRAHSPAGVPALVHAARSTLAEGAPRLAVEGVTSLRIVFDEAVGPAGQVVTLVAILAALALVLGAIGVYGMISHDVARRARDYGIRIALGLLPSLVLTQVVWRGLRLVTAGAALGIAVALVLTRLLSSLLHEVSAADPAAFAGAVLVLVAAGTLAAYIPARRASRTDPADVLRES
jgi:putative ABC transport system permease protein